MMPRDRDVGLSCRKRKVKTYVQSFPSHHRFELPTLFAQLSSTRRLGNLFSSFRHRRDFRRLHRRCPSRHRQRRRRRRRCCWRRRDVVYQWR